MKKLSILLLSFLAVFTGIQPTAAPPEGVLVKKPCSQRSWNPGPQKIAGPIWEKIINEYGEGLDCIRYKLVKVAVSTPQPSDIKAKNIYFDHVGKMVAIAPDSNITSVQSSADRKLHSFCRADNKVEIFKMGKSIGTIDNVFDAQISPDGTKIVTLSVTRDLLTIYNAQTLQVIFSISEPEEFKFVKISHNSRELLIVKSNGVASIFDMFNCKEICILGKHVEGDEIDPVFDAQFSPDGKQILVTKDMRAYRCRNATMYEVASGKKMWELKNVYASSDNTMYSPTGKQVMVADDLLNAANKGDKLTLAGLFGTCPHAAYSPCGRYVIKFSKRNRLLYLFDAKNAERVFVISHIMSDLKECYFSPDGNTIIILDCDGNVLIFDISLLNRKFSSEQIEILRLLEEHYVEGQDLWLKDIEQKNKRVNTLGLTRKFKTIFSGDLFDTVAKTYKISDFRDFEAEARKEAELHASLEEQARLATEEFEHYRERAEYRAADQARRAEEVRLRKCYEKLQQEKEEREEEEARREELKESHMQGIGKGFIIASTIIALGHAIDWLWDNTSK